MKVAYIFATQKHTVSYVLGIVLVAVRHFDNTQMGIAAATLYLLLPYTAVWTGAVTAALPGALLVLI